MTVSLEFFRSPRAFLAATDAYLARDSVLNTVVATMAHRGLVAEQAGIAPPAENWWLAVRDAGPPSGGDVGDGAGEVVGVAMRSAPFEPRPLFILPMPSAAAVELARVLHGRGEEVLALNGALPATQVCADELARLTGRTATVAVHSRLHQLGSVVAPRVPAGALRAASYADLPLALAWFEEFFVDADRQAGRPAGSHAAETPPPEEMLRRIGGGDLWFWEVDGSPVHLSALNPPSFGAARIGPVYTPVEHRGHGYAGATVAALAQMALDAGATPCLFTDQANPVSNALYARLGFTPVVDMANYVVE
jgi:GNAT superfamily N-acetyltransferase